MRNFRLWWWWVYASLPWCSNIAHTYDQHCICGKAYHLSLYTSSKVQHKQLKFTVFIETTHIIHYGLPLSGMCTQKWWRREQAFLGYLLNLNSTFLAEAVGIWVDMIVFICLHAYTTTCKSWCMHKAHCASLQLQKNICWFIIIILCCNVECCSSGGTSFSK